MRIVKISKKRNGGYRMIYVPDDDEKAAYRAIASSLEEKSRKMPGVEAAHGFMIGRSPVTNAREHIGYAYTLSFDLEDFFDSVTARQLTGKLTKEELSLVLVDGAARQGLPTSPAVSNIAASELDKAILKLVGKIRSAGGRIAYTRYADDLTFSFDDPAIGERLRRDVLAAAGRMGYTINTGKTEMQAAVAGRRIVTGVAVDDTDAYPTRAVKRKLRAAEKQENTRSAAGLQEWSKLKLPATPEEAAAKRDQEKEIKALKQGWSVSMPKAGYPTKKRKTISEDIVITGDPVYALGMSTLTTGWKSCMRQNSGAYRAGCSFWASLPGARIAAYLSKKTMTVRGVTRRVMRARSLVYTMDSGALIHDRIYGPPDDMATLKKALKEAGYISVAEARERGLGGHVRGSVDSERVPAPYLDSMQLVHTHQGRRISL